MISRSLFLLIVILSFKALVLAGYIYAGFIGLGPDEAQYWTWSESLDWGYYSKPPGIAFQIKLGTWLLGNTELGVRLGSILLSAATALSIYFLAYLGGLSIQIAFWSALAYAFSPLGVLGSLLAITDVGMFFAWTLACCGIAYALAHDKPPNYLLIGLAIAFGALFKWPIYFLWVLILLGMIFFSILRQKSWIIGVLASLVGLVPPFMWNIQHNWMTFRHVGATLAGGHAKEVGTTALFQGNALEFLGAQVVLLSPLLFGLLVVSWVTVLPRLLQLKIPKLVRWGCITSLLGLISCVSVACFQKMQGNWCIYLYVLAIPSLVWTSLKWSKRGVAFL